MKLPQTITHKKALDAARGIESDLSQFLEAMKLSQQIEEEHSTLIRRVESQCCERDLGIRKKMGLGILLATIVIMISNTKPAVAAAPGAYVELFWPLDRNYNFDIDLTVTDAPDSAIVLFWAHQFHFVEGDGGYIGLQVVGSTRKAIFSIWNAITGTPGQRFTGEGTGWQCLIDYSWKNNHPYRLRVWAAGRDEAGNEWWQGAVYEYGGKETVIGTILVPSTKGWLGSWSVTWVEYAGYTTCEAPYTRALFSKPWARNPLGDHAPQKAKASYGANLCRNSNIEYFGSGTYAIAAGTGVARNTPDGTWLWTKEPNLQATRANLGISVSPNPVSIASGQSGHVTFTLAETNGVGVTIISEAWVFIYQDGTNGPNGVDTDRIRIDPSSAVKWDRWPYLWPEVSQLARSRGWPSVVLRYTFQGTDDNGNSISVITDLTINV